MLQRPIESTPFIRSYLVMRGTEGEKSCSLDEHIHNAN